jgi:hypothetical protein
VLASLVAGVYLGNGVLELAGIVSPTNPLEVVAQLRRRGLDAYPAYLGRWESLPTGEVPIAGVRNVPTVLDHESDSWVVYQSDELGFRNPARSWDAPVRIALLGDSFVHGFGATDGHDLASAIRQREPRTLNLGRSGTGPLAQLALAREYLPAAKPELVVVFFFEGNDLTDALAELRHPLLRRYYFEPTFTQDLRASADRLDAGVRRYLDERYGSWLAASGREATLRTRLVRLTATRSLLARAGAVFRRAGTPAARSSCHAWWRQLQLAQVAVDGERQSVVPAAVDPAVEEAMRRTDEGAAAGLTAALRHAALLLAATRYVPIRGQLMPGFVYETMLARLDDLARSWGGQLVLVYLPAAETARDPACDPNRDRIRELATARGVPFIDLTDAFAGRADLDAMYRVHLTARGSRVVGDYVVDRLPDPHAGVASRRTVVPPSR